MCNFWAESWQMSAAIIPVNFRAPIFWKLPNPLAAKCRWWWSQIVVWFFLEEVFISRLRREMNSGKGWKVNYSKDAGLKDSWLLVSIQCKPRWVWSRVWWTLGRTFLYFIANCVKLCHCSLLPSHFLFLPRDRASAEESGLGGLRHFPLRMGFRFKIRIWFCISLI